MTEEEAKLSEDQRRALQDALARAASSTTGGNLDWEVEIHYALEESTRFPMLRAIDKAFDLLAKKHRGEEVESSSGMGWRNLTYAFPTEEDQMAFEKNTTKILKRFLKEKRIEGFATEPYDPE